MADDKFSLLGFIPESTKDKIVLGVVLGLIGGVSGSGYWRTGKFDNKDAVHLEEKLTARIENIENNDMECKDDISRVWAKLHGLPPEQIEVNRANIESMNSRLNYLNNTQQKLYEYVIDGRQ